MRTLRIHFSKTGEAAYISHLDLQRVMARALRRSGMPVWWSQGFNPHIYLRFALPLPLGQQSLCEAVDFKTEDDDFDPAQYVAPLNAALPRGIEVSRIAAPVYDAGKIALASYRITHPDEAILMAAAKAYNAAETAPVLRKTKRSQQEVDLKHILPSIEEMENGQNGFIVSLPAGSDSMINPQLLCNWLILDADNNAYLQITREMIWTNQGDIFS